MQKPCLARMAWRFVVIIVLRWPKSWRACSAVMAWRKFSRDSNLSRLGWYRIRVRQRESKAWLWRLSRCWSSQFLVVFCFRERLYFFFLAAPPPDVRKVSDFPGEHFHFSGYARLQLPYSFVAPTKSCAFISHSLSFI